MREWYPSETKLQ